MTSEEYLRYIVSIHRLSYPQQNTIQTVAQQLYQIIQPWANNFLVEVVYSGSYAKNTAVKGSSDLDLFISLKPETPENLSQIHDSLLKQMLSLNIPAKKQNVSIGIKYNGMNIDLTPGKKQDAYTKDHSIHSHKQNTWKKTNIHKHIDTVKNSGKTDVIKLTKIWRNLHGLDFPSFYLELSVLNALTYSRAGYMEAPFLKVLQYMRDSLRSASISDPSNTSNIVSNELSYLEKNKIAQQAATDLLNISNNYQNWTKVVW